MTFSMATQINSQSPASPTKLTFRSLESKMLYMNSIYQLPISTVPSLFPAIGWQLRQPAHNVNPEDIIFVQRLKAFKKILLDEVGEVDEIIDKVNSGAEDIDILTDLADWLGDLQVYCYSEMIRLGIPHKETMNIIMDSNFSKLDADGKPIIKDGKFEKGPFYWKPEPKLKEMLLEKIAEAEYAAQNKHIPLGDD